MLCLNPRTIPNPSKHPQGALEMLPAVAASRYKDIRPYRYDTVQIPCGKCIACLRNKQDYLVSKAYFEAKDKGSFHFVTLTYENMHLPITETLVAIDKETGEEFVPRGCVPEFVDGYKAEVLRAEFSSIPPSDSPRYIRHLLPWSDSRYEYYVNYTPSVCRFHVREWLKMARIRYERLYGRKLEFSYIAVSEMGARYCRPHYHLALFGLSDGDARWLLSWWKFGFTQLKKVKVKNEDGSDGYAAASKYIGKYMSKGKFECESVKCGLAEKPRLCQSIGIAKKMAESARPWLCAFDMYGPYDLNTLFSPSLKRYLTRSEVDSLVKEIPKRLCVQINEKTKVPLPRCVKDYVFKYASVSGENKKVSTTVWSMVACYLRDLNANIRNREFRQFLSEHPDRTFNENAAAFAEYQAFNSSLAQKAREKSYINFLQHSRF